MGVYSYFCFRNNPGHFFPTAEWLSLKSKKSILLFIAVNVFIIRQQRILEAHNLVYYRTNIIVEFSIKSHTSSILHSLPHEPVKMSGFIHFLYNNTYNYVIKLGLKHIKEIN